MKTETLVSAGGVVFKKDTSIKIAVASSRGGHFFNLPKGIVDKNESNEQAATREVREETNLKVEIISKLGVIDYWFAWEGIRFHKFVHFFLMKHLSGEAMPFDKELDDVFWIDIYKAVEKLSYPGEKEIVKKAIDYLELSS